MCWCHFELTSIGRTKPFQSEPSQELANMHSSLFREKNMYKTKTAIELLTLCISDWHMTLLSQIGTYVFDMNLSTSKMTWMWIYVKSVSFFSMDILTLYNLPPKFSKRGQQKFINPSSCSLMITNNTKCRFWKFEPHYLRQICRMLLLLQDQHRHDDVDGCVWVVYYCFAETDIAVFQQLQGLLSLVRSERERDFIVFI